VASRLKAGESFVIRLKVPREGVTKFTDLARGEISVANHVVDDQVLLKSDGFPTYHLAVVVDDHLMEISHIIRGEEWLSSTPKHILLYNAFGWEPPIYAHTPLLRGKDKSKLGKRHGALPISEFRKQGFLPEAILNYIALLGWTHPEEKEVFAIEEMIEKFELEDLNTTAPIFDPVKLTWINAQHIRRRLLENIPLPERLTRTKSTSSSTRSAMISGATTTTLPYMEKEGWVDSSKPEDWVKSSDITKLIGERISRADETTEMVRYFFEAPEIDPELLAQKGRTKEDASEMLQAAEKILAEGNLDRDHLEKFGSLLPVELFLPRFLKVSKSLVGMKQWPACIVTLKACPEPAEGMTGE